MKNEGKVIVRVAEANEPGLVDALLDANTNNRHPKDQSIQTYAEEMVSGRWILTNQGIGVSETGVLVDGQNRLMAMRRAGYPSGVKFLLVTGLSDDSKKYVDIGTKRNSADLLKLIFNVHLAARVAAAINVCIKCALGKWAIRLRPDQLIEGYNKHGEHVLRIYQIEGSSKISAPVVAALADVLSESGDERVLIFTEQLIRGEMLTSGDPALTLRNWLAMTNGKGSGGSELQKGRYFKTKNAVEAFLAGKKLAKLYLREGQE